MNNETPSKRYRTIVLLLLTLVYAFNFIDRQIIGILSPFIQKDLELTNTQLGMLKGIFFALFYTSIGIPIAWLADRYNRTNIVTISLAVWSGFTALTGMAGSFASIALARMGVGIGEAGGSPPSHSMISDLYPKEERSGALGVYSLGIPWGQGIAYALTGYLLGSQAVGFTWRELLISLGIAGVVFAVAARLIIREPQRGIQDTDTPELATKIPFKTALKTLLSIPSWWAMCMGITTASFVAYAVATWQVDYLLPFDGAMENPYGFQKMMYILGALNITLYAAGTLLGGKIVDKLAKGNLRYYGIIPAVTVLICLPLIIGAFWANSTFLHMAFGGVFLFFIGMYLAPSFAVAQTLAPINMRAMSTAIFFLILNLIALGGGPTLVGILTDIFEVNHTKVEAIRFSLTIVSSGFIISALCFLYAAKTLPKDWAEAQKRNESLKDQVR
ncbi:spinster family MFS transporter [Robiginitomaculum antarcticum]|uniref:spinster family MFS transporter n=1 Tax=Robiginitomaculum antarcticum TaxID=437507 RepID=UPI00036A4D18|nr:MFS transporter [Robiginitomaculum antarcticum]